MNREERISFAVWMMFLFTIAKTFWYTVFGTNIYLIILDVFFSVLLMNESLRYSHTVKELYEEVKGLIKNGK